MKKILIIAINYNSYDKLDSYLESIVNSIKQCSIESMCNVQIVDNSTPHKNFDYYKYSINNKLSINFEQSENLGYFGSALKQYNQFSHFVYDYVCISNVDLVVKHDFFDKLCSLTIEDNVAWIAPSIYSNYEDRDKNPQRIFRCSKNKLKLLYLLYTFPMMEVFYSKFLYPKLNKNKNTENVYKQIYCGHGSFIILTKEFIKKNPEMHFPCFLFGEELFLGEIIRNEGLKVIYESSLKIFDDEHVSTSKLPSRNYYKYNRTSISWILRTFYK